jgi:hypothetical protein
MQVERCFQNVTPFYAIVSALGFFNKTVRSGALKRRNAVKGLATVGMREAERFETNVVRVRVYLRA